MSAAPISRSPLGWSAADLGRLLYQSLHRKLLGLPDSTLVYPAHGAGSLCGKAISKETFSTIGEQRLENYALQPMRRRRVRAVSSPRISRTRPPTSPTMPCSTAASTRRSPRRSTRELEPLDLAGGPGAKGRRRAASRHARPRRIRGGSSGREHQRRPRRPVRDMGGLRARSEAADRASSANPAREREAAVRLGRIGFDNVTGYLRDGLHSLNAHPELTATTERLSPARAVGPTESTARSCAVDVRAPGERAGASHIAEQRAHPAHSARRARRRTATRSSAPGAIARAGIDPRSRRAC